MRGVATLITNALLTLLIAPFFCHRQQSRMLPPRGSNPILIYTTKERLPTKVDNRSFLAEKEGFYPFAVPDIYLRGVNPLVICRPLHNPAPSLYHPPDALGLGSPAPPVLVFESLFNSKQQKSDYPLMWIIAFFWRRRGNPNGKHNFRQ